MPSTYTLISSNVLTSSAASVTFSAIPSTYTDLVLRVSARSTVNNQYIRIAFNGNPTATTRIIYGDGASASSYTGTGAYLETSGNNTSTSTANSFGSLEVYIPNYTSTVNKPASVFSATENNSANTAVFIEARAGLIQNTVAIDSMTITPASTNFASGSSFYLYGIKNS